MSERLAQPRTLLTLLPRADWQTDEQRRKEEVDYWAARAMERHDLNPEMFDRKGDYIGRFHTQKYRNSGEYQPSNVSVRKGKA